MGTGSKDQPGSSGWAGSADVTATRGSDEETLVAGTEVRDEARELEVGASVGRFLILDRLGSGGMGVVYVAYDPELGRKVAIKLLRGDRFPADALTAGGGRLLREAQAMAKVTHANVITVHDVGTKDGQVWVAMEFVEGSTLAAWIRQAPRTRAELLRMFVPAGRGLAAVHASDLVHRDFKPDNVMVGDDGRVLVMDFGLASSGPSPLERLEDASSDASVDASSDQSSILLGGMVGTPAYMAPEQLAAGSVDARADQFAFCVSLWEALYGERPFSGATLLELASAVLDGRLRDPPRGRRVPAWLRRCLTRGLATDPARRWPSMNAMLDALERGEMAARRRWLVGGSVAIAALAGAAWGAGELDRRQTRAACAAEAASIDQVWNPTRAEALRTAFASADLPGAEATAERALEWLDVWSEDWRRTHEQACLDTRSRGTWTEERFNRADWCLEEQLFEFAEVLDTMAEDPEQSVEGAIQLAADLPVVATCVDERRLALTSAPPHESRAEVRAIRDELGLAIQLASKSEFAPALDTATRASERARALGWAPLRASAELQLANVRERQGEYDDAERVMTEAYFDAASSGASSVAAAAATDLAWLVGYRQARYAQGRLWARQAAVELERAGEEGGLHEASRLNNLSAIDYASGAFEQARASATQVLAIRERVRGADHPTIAQALSNVAIIDEALGEHQRAAEALERAIGIEEATLGPDHPELANALNNLAIVHWSTKHYAEAEPLFRRAIQIRDRAYGPEHPRTASTRSNLGILLFDAGQIDNAREAFEAALTVLERALGPEHPDLADPLSGLGRIALAQGRPNDARPLLERALSVFEQHPGAPLDQARVEFALARSLAESGGDIDRARELARAARASFAEAGPEATDQLGEADRWLAANPQE